MTGLPVGEPCFGFHFGLGPHLASRVDRASPAGRRFFKKTNNKVVPPRQVLKMTRPVESAWSPAFRVVLTLGAGSYASTSRPFRSTSSRSLLAAPILFSVPWHQHAPLVFPPLSNPTQTLGR